MELYEPINTLKPVGEDLWVVDGPIVRMAFLGASVPFPTRMVVVRLANGDLFLWSPTQPDEGLRKEIDVLGPVRHLVSPNKLHYVHVCAWKRAYPEATTWASPGARERAASRNAEVCFDRDLADEPEEAWRGDLDQLIFRGSRFMEEVIFFHRKTRALILADFIENFEPEKVGFFYAWLARLAGVADPDGKTPIDARLTFFGRKREARASLEEMMAWRPEKVIMAHGRPYYRDGTAELRRAFRWLGSKEQPAEKGGCSHSPRPHSSTPHPNFGELRKAEVQLRRITLPRTPVNKGWGADALVKRGAACPLLCAPRS